MTTRHRVLWSFLAAVAVWALFTWPLPRYFSSGIASSSDNVEKDHVRRMIVGDHLQFLYDLWLFGDTLAGRTPIFQSPYEFNAGPESETPRFQMYYLPFSLFYAATAWFGGRAVGWNVTGLLSLWLTYLATWALVRRYTSVRGLAPIAALIAILFPYRWATLLGGSPTGLAMMWVPIFLLGLDKAVRENRLAGGLLAGAALVGSEWCDIQTTFFMILISPAWCILAFLSKPDFDWKKPRSYGRLAAALLPVLIGIGLTFVQGKILHPAVSASPVSGGRSLAEVIGFSPRPQGLFSWESLGISNHIYFGYLPVVVLAIGFAILLTLWTTSPAGLPGRNGRLGGDASVPPQSPSPATRGRGGLKSECELLASDRRRDLLRISLLLLGLALMLILALGMRGPFDANLFALCRRLIPPYAMVRQTGKIFCLVPPVLAVASAVALSAWISAVRKPWWRPVCLALFALCAAAEYRSRISATVCLLDFEQPAYRAVAEDARAAGVLPRAVALPLWPGDSHFSSLDQHYGSLYRIRMMNGYRPFVPRAYIDQVFKRFESMNQGVIADDQLDDLRRRGLGHILLHEDAFPEQVSPFPVSFTLNRLLNHPSLRLLKQHERVWAFKILPSAESRPPTAGDGPYLFPARQWELERCPRSRADAVLDPSAGGRSYLALHNTQALVRISLRSPISNAPDLRWLIRARGKGTLACRLGIDTNALSVCARPIDSKEWEWIAVPVSTSIPFFDTRLELGLDEGVVDVDTAILAAGVWKSPAPGETLALPAPCFFHAGYTDRALHRVALLQERDPAEAIVFYGPKLPLNTGLYDIELSFSTSATNGTPLGRFNLRGDAFHESAWTPVIAGAPARYRLNQTGNLPFFLAFTFDRTADMTIDKVTIERLK